MTVLTSQILIVAFATIVGLLQLPLVVELVVAAWLPGSDRKSPGRTEPADILIPARNESPVLPATLQALKSQLQADDRVWLIADNCTDDTAEVGRSEGAIVIEREDAKNRGKGYALQSLIDHIEPRPDSIAVILDADCQLAPGGLDRIVSLAANTRQPVQARYQMTSASTGPQADLSQFAVLLKNTVRQRGLSRLRWPCVLSGSGMAFPWPILKAADLANDNTADDLQLTCDLALDGHTVQFCDETTVTASLPADPKVANVQRKRWIHGHLRTAFRYVPRLWWSGLTQRRLLPIAVALEVAVPPLSLLVLLHVVAVAAGVLFGLVTSSWWLAICMCASAGLLISAIGFAWWCHGRRVLPFTRITAVPAHVFGSLVSSIHLLFHRQHWAPTDRNVPPTADKGAVP